MQYSTIEPKDQIFVERYRFLSFAKNMDKNIDKNVSVSLSSKYTQKTLALNNLPQIHLKLFQRKQFKTQRKTASYLSGNKINKIAKVSNV